MEKEDAIIEADQPNPVSEQDILEKLEAKAQKYLRGNKANLEGLRDKKLGHKLKQRENYYSQSARTAARFEEYLKPSEGGYIEAENELEKTWKFKQEDIIKEVDLRSSAKAFDMILPDLGPYTINYMPNGRYVLFGGRKGHLAMIDALNLNLVKEFQVRETVRDVCFLQNEQFFAVAQKKYPYIYNQHGVEIHCLKEHGRTLKLEYLEKHYLLASSNSFSQLHYQDISTGQMVSNYKTGLGPTAIMRSNPYNSIISLGHSSGKLTMWKPTLNKPLITLLCHRGPLTAISHHPNGHLLATAGMDKKIKIWDLRKFETVYSFNGHAQSLDFSQKGLLGFANGSRVQVWKDNEVYMSHAMVKGYQVGTVRFRPYEDVLGLGHSNGFSSILIPGSGEPNFDSWVANPFETGKQRRQKEVQSLLNKLPPESIMMDPDRIGRVRERVRREKVGREERERVMREKVDDAKEIEVRKKTKGRNKPSKRAKKKEEEVFKVKKGFLDEDRREKEERREKKRARIEEKGNDDDGDDFMPKSLLKNGGKNIV